MQINTQQPHRAMAQYKQHVWKPLAALTLALKPKDLLSFSNSSSFVIYCCCFLLRISEVSHTAQNTQYAEKYLLHLVRWNISPSLFSFDTKVLQSTLLDQQTHQQKNQQESWRFFKGSVLGVTLTVHAPGGVRAPK